MKTKQSEHGGKRIGAGRPSTFSAKKEVLTINLRPGLKAKIKAKLPKGRTISSFVDEIISNFLGV